MGSENSLWKTFDKNVPGHKTRVENVVEAGTPDLNGCLGVGVDYWLELKYSSSGPVRGGIVKLYHFTDEQRRWLVKRGNAGGRCGVLWQIGSEYLLFRWDSSFLLGSLTMVELRDLAVWVGKSLKDTTFYSALNKDLLKHDGSSQDPA